MHWAPALIARSKNRAALQSFVMINHQVARLKRPVKWNSRYRRSSVGEGSSFLIQFQPFSRLQQALR